MLSDFAACLPDGQRCRVVSVVFSQEKSRARSYFKTKQNKNLYKVKECMKGGVKLPTCFSEGRCLLLMSASTSYL